LLEDDREDLRKRWRTSFEVDLGGGELRLLVSLDGIPRRWTGSSSIELEVELW